MKNRSGHYRANFRGAEPYLSFVPSPLPPKPNIELNTEIIDILTKATNSLAILESMSQRIPSYQLFVAAYVYKEALLSSQIEGTQATLEDIFDPLIETNTNRDIEEVVNYLKATEFAVNCGLPICHRLIKGIHGVLMAGARGQDKHPGEFRTTQNLIGRPGATLKTAYYIPPNPQDMLEAMNALEGYINAEDDTNVLIRAALIHYQFETIHPFLDGNGRVGRMLIMLFLMSRNILTTPALYISYFLKKNQREYYDLLGEVREHGLYEKWIKFFLQAINESAEDAVKTIDELSALHDKNIHAIQSLGRARITAQRVFDYLQSHPIIDVNKTAQSLGVVFNTAATSIKRLAELGILEQTTNARRNRVFVYKDYLDILRRGT